MALTKTLGPLEEGKPCQQFQSTRSDSDENSCVAGGPARIYHDTPVSANPRSRVHSLDDRSNRGHSNELHVRYRMRKLLMVPMNCCKPSS